MRRMTARLISAAVLAGATLDSTNATVAGGYYYRPRSFYMTPPIYANLPVFGQPPIVIYEPIVTYPAPVAGYYAPLAAPPVPPAPETAGRVRERHIATPPRSRHRYRADFSSSPDYQYRIPPQGGRVRFSERWHD